jgi:hypothetical protein
MGRKRKTLTPEQAGQVEALSAYLTQQQIADYFGIARCTFVEMLKRDEKISSAYARGRARAVERMANNLMTQSDRGSFNATKFYLETQAGWVAPKTVEHTGSVTINHKEAAKALLDALGLGEEELTDLQEETDGDEEED